CRAPARGGPQRKGGLHERRARRPARLRPPDHRPPTRPDPQDLDVVRRGELMDDDRARPQADDSLARARAIHRICESFEAAWRAGDSPAIADFLESLEPAARPELFRELLALELELRRGEGQQPTPAEYLARFPGWEPAVGAVFDEIDRTVSLESGRVDGAKGPT